jgi:hypothetical protein
MKKLLAAAVAIVGVCGAANAQQQELVSNPRGMAPNFDIANLGPILTEMGAVWEQRQAPNGQPYIVLSVGGELVLNMFPTACGQNFKNCIGLNTVALFSGSGLNYQTVTAFNQKYAFTTAGIVEDNTNAYLSRYDIADYGIPRGNVAASLINLVVLADKFRQELATAGQTVSLEGYADDLSSRLLNNRGLTAIAGPSAVEPLTVHEVALEETSELVKVLLADTETPRNKIRNITARP